MTLFPITALDDGRIIGGHDSFCPLVNGRALFGNYDPNGPDTRGTWEERNCLCPLIEQVRDDERSRMYG